MNKQRNGFLTFSFVCICVSVCVLPGARGEDVNCGGAPRAARLSNVPSRPATRERQRLLRGPGLRHHSRPQAQTLAARGMRVCSSMKPPPHPHHQKSFLLL